MTISITYQSTN